MLLAGAPIAFAIAGVAIIASIAGVGTAWLITAYDFPGRNAFVWLLPRPMQ